jgi:hypothetical protein
MWPTKQLLHGQRDTNSKGMLYLNHQNGSNASYSPNVSTSLGFWHFGVGHELNVGHNPAAKVPQTPRLTYLRTKFHKLIHPAKHI